MLVFRFFVFLLGSFTIFFYISVFRFGLIILWIYMGILC